MHRRGAGLDERARGARNVEGAGAEPGVDVDEQVTRWGGPVPPMFWLRDPDGNGVELYRDRPRQEWPRIGGQLRMTTGPLDLDGLLTELHDFEPKPEASLQETEIMKPTIEINEAIFETEVLKFSVWAVLSEAP